jgi:predicted nucleic acid-binding protein
VGRRGKVDCIIDTNVLVYDTIEDSEFHSQAAETLGTLDRWLVPSVVMEEFVSVMTKLGARREFIDRKLSELLESGEVEFVAIEPEDLRAAAALISGERISFRKFNDKLVLSTANRMKAALYTFDKDLDRQRKNLGIDSPIDGKK